VRKRLYQGWGQFVLELDPSDQPALVQGSTEGLVEALADLQLEALGTGGGATPTTRGEGDEQQDNG
jgi:hypothetical protein